MELKKSPKADLESKRKVFFEIGLIVALFACLTGFETTKGVKQVENLGVLTNQAVEEIVIPLVKEEIKKPELPPLPKVVDLLLIAENDMEIKEELTIIDSEVKPGMAIYAEMQKNTTPEKSIDEEVVFIAPEEKPEFPGGDAALLKFLNQSIKYPTVASENGIFGKVTVSFVVNKDGSVSDAKVLRSVDPALDKEALRVVYSLPKWKPGKQGGKPVRVSFSVPINFVLQ